MREVADSAWEDRSLLSELLHAASMPSASTRCKVAVRAVTRWSATLLVTISWHQECTDQHGRMRAARGLTTVLLERASLLLYNVPEAAALPAAAACVLLDNPLLDEPEHSMCAARPAHRPGGAWPAQPCLARWLLLCCAIAVLWGTAGRERVSAARFDGLRGLGEACWQAPRQAVARGAVACRG